MGGKRTAGHWVVKEDLYNWWLKKAYDEGVPGHRYYCVMALAVFAAKCGILDKKRVRRDAESLMGKFNDFAGAEPFTEDDVKSALECLDLRFCNFSRDELANYTGVPMPANRRNYRKQAEHLRRARAVQSVDYPNGEWRNKDGRPKGSGTKADVIRAYAAENPGASQRAIAEALGVSPTTVNKWMKGVRQS